VADLMKGKMARFGNWMHLFKSKDTAMHQLGISMMDRVTSV